MINNAYFNNSHDMFLIYYCKYLQLKQLFENSSATILIIS